MGWSHDPEYAAEDAYLADGLAALGWALATLALVVPGLLALAALVFVGVAR